MTRKYLLMHEEPNVNLLNLQVHCDAFLDPRLKKFIGSNLSGLFYAVENHRFKWGPNKHDWNQAESRVLDLTKRNPQIALASEVWVQRVGAKIYTLALPYVISGGREPSDQKRVETIKKLFSLNLEICVAGYYGPILDFHKELLTNEIIGLIKRHTKVPNQIAHDFQILTTPIERCPAAQADWELLQLIKKARQGHSISREIAAHIQKYPWIGYTYRGPVRTARVVQAEFLRRKRSKDFDDFYHRKQNELNQIIREQKRITRTLKLSRHEIALIKAARSVAYAKLLRRDMLALSNYTIHLLGRPLWKQQGYTFEDIDVLTIDEFINLLGGQKPIGATEANARKKFLLYLRTTNSRRILTGRAARSWIAENAETRASPKTDLQLIRGTVACSGGVIRRNAKLLEITDDLKKFRPGDILISTQTTPDLLPAMRLAGAIVTDQGGLTSHAAIVSRELNIPCVIGTKFATKIFKDGDQVEVDATRGVVRKL